MDVCQLIMKKRKPSQDDKTTSNKRQKTTRRTSNDLKRNHLQLFEIRDPELTKQVDDIFLTDDTLIVMQPDRLLCYNIQDRQLQAIIQIPVEKSVLTDGAMVDECTMIVVSRDFHVFVINVITANVIYQFSLPKSSEGEIVITDYRDDKLVMCAPQEIAIVELDIEEIVKKLGDPNNNSDACNDENIVSAEQRILHKELSHFEVEEEIESCALWPKGLITGGQDGYLRFYDIGSHVPNKRILAGNPQPQSTVASIFNIYIMKQDPSIAITHSYDGHLKKWDLETDLTLQSVQTEKKIGGHALCVHEDSNLVITGQNWDPTLRFWKLDTLELLFPYRIKCENDNNEKLQHVHKITASPNGCSISLGTNLDVVFLFINLKRTKELTTLPRF